MNYAIWVSPKPSDTPTDIEGPTPERAGLKPNLWYRVLELHDNGHIGSEAYYSVVNEEGETWFVSNRHFVVMDIQNSEGLSIAFIKEPPSSY